MKCTFIFVFIHSVVWAVYLVVDLEVRDIIIEEPETATTFLDMFFFVGCCLSKIQMYCIASGNSFPKYK